jgi:hypothetical protein
VDLLSEAWSRATTPQPLPSAVVVLLAALLALAFVLVPTGWNLARHALTVLHEGAHAAVAVLTGRRLAGIRLHTDTSGLTVSVGRPRGPGMVATTAAGYPGPALVGLAAAWVLGQGYAVGVLWVLLVAVVLLLLQVRYAYGVLVLLLGGAGLAALTWWAPTAWQVAVAYALTCFLLLGSPRAVLELQTHRRRDRRSGRARTSDADQLARLTLFPAIGWVGLFLVVTVGALVQGMAWILPL